MSSIIRRRRGLISVIGGAPALRIGLRQPQSSQTGGLPPNRSLHSRDSGFVQSPFPRTIRLARIQYHTVPRRVTHPFWGRPKLYRGPVLSSLTERSNHGFDLLPQGRNVEWLDDVAADPRFFRGDDILGFGLPRH